MNSQEAVHPQDAPRTRDEPTPERVPFEAPPPRESEPRSDADSRYVDRLLPLVVFSIVIALYAGIGYGCYLLLGSLL